MIGFAQVYFRELRIARNIGIRRLSHRRSQRQRGGVLPY